MMELSSHIDFAGRDVLSTHATLPPLRIGYEYIDPVVALTQSDVLAVIGFGSNASQNSLAGYLHVGLEPLLQPAPMEVWRGSGNIQRGEDNIIRYSTDGNYLFAALEIEESERGGIASTAQFAYTTLRTWCQSAPGWHVLRIWNYLGAINEGDGDDERYRQFCAGRARGMDTLFAKGYPAATAIGLRDGRRVLQLYWLAAREAGAPIENPRQLSAWRYPRRYGPSAPTFARGMRAPTQSPQIYISGTAAIIGHTSHHAGNCSAQLEETLANIDSLLATARVDADARFGAGSALKIYARNTADAKMMHARLRAHFGADTPMLILQGDICRAELLVEIDGIQNTRHDL
jgi:chorismate lyase / 3-hydroxybenzoate synthase